MDILGSILAYLGCMAGIVGALLVSFAMFFSAPAVPQPPAHGQSIAATAKAATPSAATASPATVPAKPDRAASVVSTIAQNATPPSATPQKAAPAPIPTASARSKMLTARAQKMRRFAQEERARRWAYQQDPDFESRFLGYAD